MPGNNKWRSSTKLDYNGDVNNTWCIRHGKISIVHTLVAAGFIPLFKEIK